MSINNILTHFVLIYHAPNICDLIIQIETSNSKVIFVKIFYLKLY